MNYLTTHDIVWINTTVSGEMQPFDYFALEAAMAAQYQYGDSRDVAVQAANFLGKLLLQPAFAGGNRRTALISMLTFLNANGYATTATDEQITAKFTELERGGITSNDVIAAIAAPAKTPIAGVSLRQLITHECNHHTEALKSLTLHD